MIIFITGRAGTRKSGYAGMGEFGEKKLGRSFNLQVAAHQYVVGKAKAPYEQLAKSRS